MKRLMHISPRLALALFLMITQARAGSPVHAVPDVHIVGLQGDAWTYSYALSSLRGPVRIEHVRRGEKLTRGRLIRTGNSTKLQLLVGGHTVVDVDSRSLVALHVPVRRSASSPEDELCEVIRLISGRLDVVSDPRHVPAGRTVVVITGREVRSTAEGPVHARVPEPSGASACPVPRLGPVPTVPVLRASRPARKAR